MSESDHGNDTNHEEPAPRPKKRSLVWQFFEKLNQFRIRCYLCQHEQNYQGTTGNILRHMKSKHDLDLTLKGQQDPENQKRIKELCGVAVAVTGKEIKIERYYAPHTNKPASKRKQLFHDRFDVHPLEENGDDDGICPYVASEDPFDMNEDSMATTYGEQLTDAIKKNKSQLEDDRIKAETLYFREKAGYYKFLKHLTALKAKKVKVEIELLTTSDNKIV